MSTLRVSETIPWPKRALGVDWYRAGITLDAAGAFALARYVDIRKGLRGGLLWDLTKQALVPGEHLDLHPRLRRAVLSAGVLAVARLPADDADWPALTVLRFGEEPPATEPKKRAKAKGR